MTIAVVLVVAAGCGDARYHSTRVARLVQASAHAWPGGHGVAFWDAHTPAFLRFFARACA